MMIIIPSNIFIALSNKAVNFSVGSLLGVLDPLCPAAADSGHRGPDRGDAQSTDLGSICKKGIRRVESSMGINSVDL